MRITAPVSPNRRSIAGFNLIEVLIAMVVMSLAFLGSSSMILTTMKATHGGALRDSAVRLANDMAERLEGNKAAALNGAYALAAGAAPGAGADCTAQACTAAELAGYDLAGWYNLVQSKLPGASAAVTRTAAGPPAVYEIRLVWTDRAWGKSGGDGTETFTYVTTRAVSP